MSFDTNACQCLVCQEERAAAPPLSMEDQFKARFITPIPDDECTDMGDYVIWNKYDPTCTLITTAPSETVRIVGATSVGYGVDYAKEAKYRAHLTKPAYITGWFYARGNDTEIFYYVARHGRPRSTTHSRNGAFYDADLSAASVVTANSLTPCAPSRIARLSRIRTLLDRHTPNNYTTRRGMADAMLYPDQEMIQYRGGTMSQRAFVDARRRLREVGALIRAAARGGDYDVGDVCEIIAHLRDQSNLYAQADRAMRAWNEHCMGGDEIEAGACGHVFRSDDGHSVRGDAVVCDDCFRADYVSVQDRDEYYHRDDVYLHSDDEYYTYPEDRYDEDEDEDEDSLPHVRNYSDDVLHYLQRDDKIVPSSYGDFLMGIELETTAARHSYAADAADDTHATLCPGYAIMKRDGSIGDNGFEIVTAPRGLKEHIERFGKWTPHDKMRAWDGGRCGLHVHISSQAFTQATLGKFVEFITAPENTSLIVRIAGRHYTTDGNAGTYCRGENGLFNGNPKKTLAYKSADRYRMVNLTNLANREAYRLGVPHCDNGEINTVELRIFRASLKKARLLAQIEFAHAAVMFCRWSSMRELREEHFMAWLKKSAGSYPNLARWFGVRSNTNVVAVLPAVADPVEV